MSGGVMFVICIPTEAAERKLCASDAAATPTPSTASDNGMRENSAPQVPVITLMPPPLGHPNPPLSVGVEAIKRNSFGSQSPLLASSAMHVANERNLVRLSNWEVR